MGYYGFFFLSVACGNYMHIFLTQVSDLDFEFEFIA